MNRQTLDGWCRWGILGLLLGVLLFGPLAMGGVDAPEFLVLQGMVAAILLLWALRLWFNPEPKMVWPPLGWVVLAFAALAVGRCLTADIEYVARQEMIRVLLYALLFFAIINNCRRQETAQLISFPLIFLAAGIASVAVYQFFTHSNRVWGYVSPYIGRASGTYISPNNLAGFLEMLIPLAAAYVLVGRMKPVVRILLGYAVLAMLAGMVVTFSRAGWVAVTVALFVLLMILAFHRNHRLPAVLLLIILAGGGTLFVTKYLSKSLTYIQRVGAPASSEPFDFSVRRDIWFAAGQMWRDHFWWGVGPAHYDYRFREYRPENVQMSPDRAHNDYLNLLADWGTVGGVVVLTGLVLFGAGLKKTWKHVRPSENDFGRGLSNRFAFFLGASTGLLALAIHSVVDFNLHIPANAILGVTLLALLTGNLRFTREPYRQPVGLPLQVLVTLVLLGGVIYLGVQGWHRAREAYWLARAAQAPLYSPAQVAALESAYAAEPQNSETTYALGEAYRVESFDGGQNYRQLADQAMQWYDRGMKLNPHDGYNYLRHGMCLDWLDKPTEAAPYFSRADTLDPNGYYTAANVGWHFVQIEDYAAARPWLERSLRLEKKGNGAAAPYLEIAERKLTEIASGQVVFPPVGARK
ncbi:MAG TPA: O-antigen ligase family protein [Candidatus Acidoferrum sp.]|nr:O-antigen ligase family protein [Candidatus Acidoferrum sp.]